MKMLILKTDIITETDFKTVKAKLKDDYNINELTIDLEDIDKVVRIIGHNFKKDDLLKKIRGLGYNCEELPE